MLPSTSNRNDTLRRALCNQILSTLPRELRDRIYEFLLGSSMCHVRRWTKGYDDTSDIHLDESIDPSVSRTLCRIGGIHMRDFVPELVGAAMRKEIVETLYRISRFQVRFHDSISLFLEQNPWNVEVEPREWVTSVQLNIDEKALLWQNVPFHDIQVENRARLSLLDTLVLDSSTHYNIRNAAIQLEIEFERLTSQKKVYQTEKIACSLRSLSLTLEELFLFKAGTRVTINLTNHTYRFCSDWEYFALGWWQQALKTVYGAIQRMKDAGYRLTVMKGSGVTLDMDEMSSADDLIDWMTVGK